jgi:hypothetical protein
MTNSNPRIAKIMPLEYYNDRLQPFLTNPLSRGSGRNRIDSAWRFGRRAYRTVACGGIELMMSSISERRKLLSKIFEWLLPRPDKLTVLWPVLGEKTFNPYPTLEALFRLV